jgi:exopolysaccharide biosynthesis polyprenyl glycosylphosphotransferase
MHTNVFKRQVVMNIFKLLDLAMLGSVFFITMAIMIHPFSIKTLVAFIDMRVSLPNVLFLIIYGIICHIVFSLYGMYDSHRLGGFFREIGSILKVVAICTAVLFAGDLLFPMRMTTSRFTSIFGIVLFVVFALNRIILRTFLAILRVQGRNLRYALIIGKNKRSKEFAKKLMLNTKLGYRFNGFIDVHHSVNSNLADDRACDLDGFQEYVRNNIVDEIFLFLPIKSFYSELNRIITICEEQGIIVRMQPDIFELRFARARVEQLGQDSMLTLYTGNMNHGSILVKEAIDIFAAFILIILTSPIMLIAALLVKISSPGPVFFLQERMGLHKRKFKIIKFRTMYRDAEQRLDEFAHLNEMGSKGAFKIKNDPRITPIGKILRVLSIDEFPQFFNILKGDMSLIGPRPLTIRDFNGFEIDHQRRRFSVKPGLSCLWQISGRSNISFDEWMALDMEYIDNWSLGLDMKIFFKTIFTVLKAEGAH